MKKRSEKERRATAYHEAGHAVVAFTLNRAFRRISIIQDEETLGHVLYRKWHKKFDPNGMEPDRARLPIEKAIMTAYAGHEAEYNFTGRHNHIGSDFDSRQAADFATYIIDDWEKELPAFLTWLRIRTRNILQAPAHWRAVEVLAEALLEKEEIGATEAKQIIIRGMQMWGEEAQAQARTKRAEGKEQTWRGNGSSMNFVCYV
jgi:ATP-dependent Zn protease